MSEADCAACLEVALDAQSPDARREAVVHIAKTSYLTRDVVVRALTTIAQTDKSGSVRFAAIRALAKAGIPEVVEPLLGIASAPDETGAALQAESGEARWAALEGLDPLVERGELSDAQRETCQVAACRLLNHHRARDVRIAAARLLRHFRDRAVLTTLIDALEQRDFGVVYHSERSLMHLTGQSFDYAAAGWRQWLAATDDPFEQAGRLDAELYPKEPNWWERSLHATRQSFTGFRPK
ncbi:MAG: HEAT repeat domain-containing protein [Planctomycetota bacterium]